MSRYGSEPDTYYGMYVKRQHQAIKNAVDNVGRPWSQNKGLLLAICEEAGFDELHEFLEDDGWDELGAMSLQAHDDYGDEAYLWEEDDVPETVTMTFELVSDD